MKNPSTKYLILLGATVLAFVLVEYFRPKPLDWRPTYANRDAIPYGTKATYELLPGLFANQPVRTVRVPVYNHLRETTLPKRSSYVFISQAVDFDENDVKHLLRYAARGNHVFIAAQRFPKTLTDTLGIQTEESVYLPKTDSLTRGLDSLTLNFTNPTLQVRSGYAFPIRELLASNFKLDSLPNIGLKRASTLGVNNRDQATFIKIPFGKGAVLLHSVPQAFTNFYVLRNPTAEYACKALSYLPDAPVFWDEYQKQGRVGEESMFRFLLSHPSLTWAYYLILATLTLFVLSHSRRRQRVIPVVEPPRNTSLEFAETIGQLYFQQGNHRDLAEKKIAHWLAFVRQQFHLPTHEFDDEFRRHLAAKSGVSRVDVDALLARVEAVRASETLSEAQLLDLNRRVEAFYQTSHA